MASKSKRNKTKFKITKELIFLISFLAVIIIATVVLSIPSANATASTMIAERTMTSLSPCPSSDASASTSSGSEARRQR